MKRPLTRREREILELLAVGWNQFDIAAELNLSVQTVKNHRASIYKKVGSHSIVETFYMLGWLKIPRSDQ